MDTMPADIAEEDLALLYCPEQGAGSGRETAFWCCSGIVARAILLPKARQRTVYLGNTG
jgi:hypothetical protein